jgi:lysophospholipase L1-like esterase
MRFLALGDSYTIGEGVTPSERWVTQLATMLREQGLPIEDPEIIAKTGWTTDELAAAIRAENPQPPYALVSLLIGVNNQYRGWSKNTYREEFGALLQQAIDFASGNPKRVIVLSIPDWSITPFATSDPHRRTLEMIYDEIMLFNTINRKRTDQFAAHYLDITPISQGALNDLTLLAPDKLHPSGKMYKLWAESALSIALEILSL